jgi:hypothetical protein
MNNAAPNGIANRREQTEGYQYENWAAFIGGYRKSWIVKGALARGETSAWIGPPGSLKSALMADLAIAVSYGLDWHGLKTCGAGIAVVYFALERADLVRRRIVAGVNRLGLDPSKCGIYVVPGTVDLVDQRSVARAVATIKNIEATERVTVGLSIFDTFAKLIAAGGGDEDKARDQGRLLANLERFKEAAFRPHIALVGHTGKDATRGARGSNAILGDVDVMVSISGQGAVKTARVIKANDGPEGPLFSFTTALHEFGKDDDGDPITVNVISSEAVEATPSRSVKSRMSPRQQRALSALCDVVRSNGQAPDFELPTGIRVVEVDHWRRELFNRGVLSREGANPRQDFKRLNEQLLAQGCIGRKDNFVWRV